MRLPALSDWLIDRRHCDLRWLGQARPLRERVLAGLPQLPEDDQQLVALRDKRPLNYFHCQLILEAVKARDGDAKSLFGKYTSHRVQVWDEIVRGFEKKSVYLAECAQQLSRNVNYEIPALKQRVLRCQQVQRDSDKKEVEARTSAASLSEKFISCCKEIGIEGVRVCEELQQLVSELPVIFQHIVSLLPSLAPAVHIYQSFIQDSTGRPVQLSQFLPMLSYVMKNGNVTIYQWKHGTEPEDRCQQSAFDPRAVEEASEQIDWGELEPSQAMDVVLGQESNPFTSGDIDWDVVGTLDVCEIEVVEESALGEEKSALGEEESAPGEEEELETLLSNTSTRNLFVDDVMELKEFLSWRIRELSKDSDSDVLFGQFSEGLRPHGLESITPELACVASVLDLLTSARTQHLLFMKSSARYLDRMATTLLSPQLLAQKATAQAEAMAVRREEAVDSALALQPQLATLISDTKELQAQLEKKISHLYRGREVNIIGEINLV